MRRLLTALTALIFVACSGPTGPEGLEIPDGPLQMALVSGAGQEVTVTDTLPTDIVVRVEKGGEALPDQLVDWTVLHDNCGSAFVTTTRTDAEGQTGNRLVAGTRAWTRPDGPDVCQMEVRYALTVADTVQARVDTTVSYRVEPGVASDFISETINWRGFDGVVTLPADLVTDQYGNPALYTLDPTCCVHRDGGDPGTEAHRTLVFDSAGVGEVRVMVADTLIDTALLTVHDHEEIEVNFSAHDGS